MSANSPEDWLRLFVEAEDAATAAGVDRRSFLLMPHGGMQWSMDHPGWDPESPLPTEHDIDDLIELGWLRPIGWDTSRKQRQFTVSLQGQVHATKMDRVSEQGASLPVSMEWSEMEPTLHAAVAAFENVGAPAVGVAVQSFAAPAEARAAVTELTHAGLLTDAGGDVDEIDGPLFVRPTAEAYKLTRGWPSDSADVAIDRLIECYWRARRRRTTTRSAAALKARWHGSVGSGRAYSRARRAASRRRCSYTAAAATHQANGATQSRVRLAYMQIQYVVFGVVISMIEAQRPDRDVDALRATRPSTDLP